jgi:hypothetical protein
VRLSVDPFLNLSIEVVWIYSLNVPPASIRRFGNTPKALGTVSIPAYNLCVKKIPLVRIGFLVAFSPVIAAFVFSLFNGGSMFDEGSGGGGYLWFLMATLPIGFIIIVIGLILLVVNKLKPKDGL